MVIIWNKCYIILYFNARMTSPQQYDISFTCLSWQPCKGWQKITCCIPLGVMVGLVYAIVTLVETWAKLKKQDWKVTVCYIRVFSKSTKLITFCIIISHVYNLSMVSKWAMMSLSPYKGTLYPAVEKHVIMKWSCYYYVIHTLYHTATTLHCDVSSFPQLTYWYIPFPL